MTTDSAPRFRPEQEQIILGYSRGKVGIAAVPGSGKTFTLAHLAAHLIADRRLARDQEVLIVTFTNSAVNSFQARIARILRDQYGLLPHVGYRVRTLHGLAHDIVRERPALVGLADDFVILDERASLEIQRDLVVTRLPDWWDRLSQYVDPELPNPKNIRYQFEQDLPDLVSKWIKRAKDFRWGPDELESALAAADQRFDLARFAVHIYRDYQRSLAYRSAVDFDDLVKLALQTLEMDERYLQRLRERWPYILEDEAQDSSQLQEQTLRLLAQHGNWVRVGDPNQAINTTFTTAQSSHLVEFLDRKKNPGVVERPLSVSGRSVSPIITLANELVRWAVEEHPNPELRQAFDRIENGKRGIVRGVIYPSPEGDPQPNPSETEALIHIHYRPDQKIDPDKELEMVVAGEDFSLVNWLDEIKEFPEEQRPTAAVLVPTNSRGFKLVELLRKYGVPYEELLRSTTATRQAVTLLRVVLEYLGDPADLKLLKQLYWALMPDARRVLVRDDVDLRQVITKVFADWHNVEEFLWPAGEKFELNREAAAYPWLSDDLGDFRVRVRRWLEAAGLPVNQLVLTISQDLFSDPVDVALGHKVAVLLHGIAQTHSDWRLPQFVEELRAIGNNERKFIGFDDAEEGYEPRPGVVTVATMHAAKGLEWDRVYLLSVSNYDFPSALPYDSYVGERWYVRDSLNLEAEALDQLRALGSHDLGSYDEGQATRQARLEYAAERLRLFYVGITRAKRELIVTWNMGRFWRDGRENQPALSLVALSDRVGRV